MRVNFNTVIKLCKHLCESQPRDSDPIGSVLHSIHGRAGSFKFHVNKMNKVCRKILHYVGCGIREEFKYRHTIGKNS